MKKKIGLLIVGFVLLLTFTMPLSQVIGYDLPDPPGPEKDWGWYDFDSYEYSSSCYRYDFDMAVFGASLVDSSGAFVSPGIVFLKEISGKNYGYINGVVGGGHDGRITYTVNNAEFDDTIWITMDCENGGGTIAIYFDGSYRIFGGLAVETSWHTNDLFVYGSEVLAEQGNGLRVSINSDMPNEVTIRCQGNTNYDQNENSYYKITFGINFEFSCDKDDVGIGVYLSAASMKYAMVMSDGDANIITW